jgi:predicted naringenin-chalcone synthase
MKSYITAIGTANPVFCYPQMKIAEFMAEAVEMNKADRIKLKALYKATGIKQRYTVIPDFGIEPEQFQFFPKVKTLEPFPAVSQRMSLYKKEALPLSLKAINNCLSKSSLKPTDITHLITVSCTGMYAPGMDLEILQTMGMSLTIERTCINFMGCYAAFNALKFADYICRSEKQAKVLIVSTELCTIHYQKKTEWDHLLSNALFADGSAAALVEGTPSENINLSLESFHTQVEPKGEQDMAWQISDFGFEMTLSSYVPDLIRTGIKDLVNDLMTKVGTGRDMDYYAIHPGGKKILEVIEEELGFSKEDNRFAYKVLQNCGNMSSSTVLFVLEALMKELNQTAEGKNVLSLAFGPGLTLESMLLKVCVKEREPVNQRIREYASA